ncbi:hypothetical protein L0244_30005, partial [bacterium]|nr:hypothetical protein [bacterium]
QEARLRDFQNPTVLVNGSPAEPVPVHDKHDPSISESTQESQTVFVNDKKAFRPSDIDNCDNSKEPIK